MASARELSDLFANLPAEEKQKFMRQLSSVHAQDEIHGIQQPQTTPSPPKKSVNGFMAFRSYYSNLFSGLQQKERSPFLRRLYDTDPFRAEWEFVARVYSHMRNDALKLGGEAPLRAFLAAACPIMHILAPEVYFVTCGWVLERVDDTSGSRKHHELRRIDGAESRLECLRKATPPLNSFDLLLRCLGNGYELENGQDVLYRMMERQEHLMTKALGVVDSKRRLQNGTQHGGFFTWDLNMPSPARDMTSHSPREHLINFSDDAHHHPSSSPDDTNTLMSSPSAQSSSDLAYQLDMSSPATDMYKFAFDGGDGGGGFRCDAEDELAAMQMVDGMAGQLQFGTGDGMGGAAAAGERDLFGLSGGFMDPYMNGGLGFGHGEGF